MARRRERKTLYLRFFANIRSLTLSAQFVRINLMSKSNVVLRRVEHPTSYLLFCKPRNKDTDILQDSKKKKEKGDVRNGHLISYSSQHQ